MATISVILAIWVFISMCYIECGMKFIDKIKNHFKICLFAILLGPTFWVLMILMGVVFFVIIICESISKITTPISQAIKQWWTK